MAIMNIQFGWVPVRVNEALTVQWPTGLHALMTFLQPDMLVERLMTEFDRIANTPCPLAQRDSRSPNSKRRSNRLQRTEKPSSYHRCATRGWMPTMGRAGC